MEQFLQLIQKPSPALYFLENKHTLSPIERQHFHDWLLDRAECCEVVDIRAMAYCRMNGAVHTPPLSVLTFIELPTSVPQQNEIQKISALCRDRNQHVFLVGGCVRDRMLGKDFVDIDCCLEADPVAFVDALMQKHGGHCDTAARFGAVHWHSSAQKTIDFTQTRQEIYPQKGQLPQVKPASIDIDLRRRDFTINAMAIPLHPEKKGLLLDPFQGLSDLQSKRLRILHPLSFWDDPTRIFRGSRYAARYGLRCSRMTARALSFTLEEIQLGVDISWQRIGQELSLILLEKHPLQAFQKLEEWGVLRKWFPAWSNILPVFSKIQEDYPYDSTIEKYQIYWIALSLPLSAEERKYMLGMVSQRPVIRKLWIETALIMERLLRRKKSLHSWGEFGEVVQNASREQIVALSLFFPELQSYFDWWQKEGHHIVCAVSGNDLLQLGCPKGPLVGRSLAAARRAAWNGLGPDAQRQEAQKVWLLHPENDNSR